MLFTYTANVNIKIENISICQNYRSHFFTAGFMFLNSEWMELSMAFITCNKLSLIFFPIHLGIVEF